jgi:hypothetical protein
MHGAFGLTGVIMKKLIALSLGAAVLSGCALTLPVQGQSSDGRETFTGKATGYADGAGNLEITSSRGRHCQGTFVYTSDRTGKGTFRCNDGSSGPFEFVSTGMRGTGTGTIGGRAFTFTFG